MDLDKINKSIWLTIGVLILVGILTGMGSIAYGILRCHMYKPDGIAVQTVQDEGKESRYELKTVYEMPLLIEGSDFFVVPVSLKKVAKTPEGEGYALKSYSGTSSSSHYTKVSYVNYNYFDGPCYNLVFIHKKSGKAEKLLGERAYIDSVYFPERKYLPGEESQPTFILLKLGNRDTNGDGVINQKDALSAYLVDLDGKNLTQVTPSETNMRSWRYDRDSRRLFIEIIEDTNGDKKFTKEDQEKILSVNVDSPGIGQELIPESIKGNIEKSVQS